MFANEERQALVVGELKQVLANRQSFDLTTASISSSGSPVMQTKIDKHNNPPLVMMPSRLRKPTAAGNFAYSEQMNGRFSAAHLEDPFEQVSLQWEKEHYHQFESGNAGKQTGEKETTSFYSAAAAAAPVAVGPRRSSAPFVGGGRIRHCYPETSSTPNLDFDHNRLALEHLEQITRELSELGRNAWSDRLLTAPFKLPSSPTLPDCTAAGERPPLLYHTLPDHVQPAVVGLRRNGTPQEELNDHMGNLCSGSGEHSSDNDKDDHGDDDHNRFPSDLVSGPPMREENTDAEMARFRHFVVSVSQDYQHLQHLSLDTLRTLVTFGSRGETRLRHLWHASAKAAERHKLISYVSIFHRINGMLRSQLKQREEDETRGNSFDDLLGKSCFEQMEPMPLFSPLMVFAQKLQMESQLYRASLPVEYVINYSEKLSSIEESTEEAENVMQCQSFEHIVKSNATNENSESNNDHKAHKNKETNPPIIPLPIPKRKFCKFF